MTSPSAALPPLSRPGAAGTPRASWWSRCRAWFNAWGARRRDAAAIQQLAWHDARVLDDIGAPSHWRAQVQVQRERRERWQVGMLDVGSPRPGR